MRHHQMRPMHHRHMREEISNEGVFSNPLALLENPILFENPISDGAKAAIGLAVVAAIGIGAYFLLKPAAAATPPSPVTNPGASYNPNAAISALVSPTGTSTLTVPVGASVTAQNTGAMWISPGVTTSDATVLAPSVPATTDGFVAVKAGTATLTGSYTDPASQQTVTATISVTVTAGVMKIGDTGLTDVTTATGPYTNISGSSMQPGEVYLYSSPAQSGTTLAQAVTNLTNAGFNVFQSWDVGQIPSSWPIDDASPYEWRFVLQYNGTSPANPGAGNLYSTAGAIGARRTGQAGVGARASAAPGQGYTAMECMTFCREEGNRSVCVEVCSGGPSTPAPPPENTPQVYPGTKTRWRAVSRRTVR